MTPVIFPEKNFTYGPPKGASEEECGQLPCHKGNEAEGQWPRIPLPCYKGQEQGGLGWPVIISAWTLTEEEMHEINRSRLVWLRVYSTGMYPISLSGINPWGTEPKATDLRLKDIGDLYEAGKECLHSMSILSDEMEHRDKLYEVLKELRDLAASQLKGNS